VVAIAGQGMALSSDYIIKVAPGISAKAAGVDADTVADKALVLSLIVGVTALVITWVMQRRSFRTPSPELLVEWEGVADRGAVAEIDARRRADEPDAPTGGVAHPVPDVAPAATAVVADAAPTATIIREDAADEPRPVQKMLCAKIFAVLVPLVYLGFIVYLLLGKFTSLVPPLKGGDAAAIVGGLAAVVLFAASATNDKRNFLETSSQHVVDGLVFAFKAMGVVLPIAGFFFIGNGDFSGAILGLPEGTKGPAFLFDIITAAQSHLSPNAFVISFGVLIVGLIAGLEGSGFSGLPLTGSLAGALGPVVGMDPTTLAAIGQMGNIWSGGGTLVAWSSLIAVAGFARVPVMSLARKCFLPVMAGLVLCTVFAILVY
jgi:hypothetical protein